MDAPVFYLRPPEETITVHNRDKEMPEPCQ